MIWKLIAGGPELWFTVGQQGFFLASQVSLCIVKARPQARPAVPLLCDWSVRVQVCVSVLKECCPELLPLVST